MRTIVHVSDLHFGRVDATLLAPLREAVVAARPDVIVVSGDLTQRARRSQFMEAAAYLRTLPARHIVVPGNHDVPLYDVVHRFASPLRRFRKYIEREDFPTFIDDEIAVVGINTARSLTFKNGRINERQVAEIERRFHGLPDAVTRIVVTHHPFDVPEDGDARDLLGRAPMAVAVFARAGVDVMLSGHLHRGNVGGTAKRYGVAGFDALVVQAGTATSTRGRGEANGFNALRIGPDTIEVQTWQFDDALRRFAQAATQRFGHTPGRGWARAGE